MPTTCNNWDSHFPIFEITCPLNKRLKSHFLGAITVGSVVVSEAQSINCTSSKLAPNPSAGPSAVNFNVLIP